MLPGVDVVSDGWDLAGWAVEVADGSAVVGLCYCVAVVLGSAWGLSEFGSEVG